MPCKKVISQFFYLGFLQGNLFAFIQRKVFCLPVLLIAAGLFCNNDSKGQKFNFNTYTISSGLVSNEIRGIFQDARGAIYLTTPSGISIFDGYRFKNFGYKDGIKYDYIKHMAELDSGKVYLFANTGRQAYIFQNNSYKRFIVTPNIITQYFKGKDNNHYVCTDIGIYQLKNDAFKKQRLTDDTSVMANSFFKYADVNDSISLVLKTYPQNRLDIINKNSRKIIFKIPEFLGFQLFKDSQKRIWVCTDSRGIKMIDEQTLQTPEKLFDHTPAVFNSLEGIQVNSVAEDAQKNLWFATTGKGLVKLEPNGTCHFISTKNGLLSNNILKVFVDRDNKIWIGTQSGLQQIAENNTALYDKSAGLQNDAVYAALQTDSNRYLVSTFHHLEVIDSRKENIAAIEIPYFAEGYIFKLIKKDNGEIWGLTSRRIVKIGFEGTKPVMKLSRPADEILSDFIAMPDGSFLVLSKTKIYHFSQDKFITLAYGLPSGKCLIKDNSGHIWAGTNKGLFIYDLQNNSLSYALQNKLSGYCFDNVFEIKILAADSRGNIWGGSKENGIYQLEISADTLLRKRHISRENGLSNNMIRYLLFNNDSTLYCSSTSGVDKIVFTSTGYNITNVNNIINLTGSAYSIYQEKDYNSILFTGLSGLLVFNGQMERNNAQTIHNSFTDCIVNGISVTAMLTKDIVLFENNQNSPTFYFSPYDFNKNNYAFYYWLDNGEKENWQKLDNVNFVRFSNLPHGQYTIYIKCLNRQNDQVVSVISKKFIIQPLWYQTVLFILGVILLTGFLIFYLVRKRINELKQKAAIQQKITETEMAALKAQMNPHFMFNCINSIDAFIHSNDKYNATLYLNKFARLLRGILDSSHQNTVTFSKDIDTLKLYIEMEELRHENQFITKYDIEEELMNSGYKVPPLIIQPFVENAILHGLKNRQDNNGILHIEVKRAADKIHYCIQDNGIGRAAAKQIMQNKESSYGMHMSYDRIKLFNQERQPSVTVTDLKNDGYPAGTKIEVLLKII